MQLEWGYNSIVIPVVNIRYYTIKLRFSDSTFGWISLPSTIKVRVTYKNGYHTIQYVTADKNEFIYVKDRIREGQQNQLSYILKVWIETGYRMRPMDAINPEIVGEKDCLN